MKYVRPALIDLSDNKKGYGEGETCDAGSSALDCGSGAIASRCCSAGEAQD